MSVGSGRGPLSLGPAPCSLAASAPGAEQCPLTWGAPCLRPAPRAGDLGECVLRKEPLDFSPGSSTTSSES